MGINDQALEELRSQGILNSDLPFETFKNNESVSVTTLGGVSQQTPVTDGLKKGLMSPKTTYKTIVDGVETISDMESVQATIARKNTICFSDAEEVAMTFENFRSSVSIQEFTRSPSQVNLAFVKRFMRDEVALKKKDLKTNLDFFFSDPLENIEELFTEYREFFSRSLLGEITEFQTKSNPWLENVKNVQGQVFKSGDSFINLATISIESFPKSFEGPGDTKLFLSAVETILNIWKKGFFKNKVELLNFCSSHQQHSSVVLLDFISMFSKKEFLEFILELERKTEAEVLILKNIKKEVQLTPSDFKQVRDFVVTHGPVIFNATEVVSSYMEFIEELRILFPCVSVVLDYFKV